MSIDPSRVRVRGPLSPFAPGFAEELIRQGYTPISATNQMRLFVHLSCWLASEGLDANELGTAEIDRYVRARRANGCRQLRSIKAMRPLVAHLRALGVVPPPRSVPDGPVGELLARYRSYLTIERGLGDPTARGYVDTMRHFLRGRLSADGLVLHLANLAAADVVAYVVGRCPQQRRGVAKLTVTALRSLLGFLHIEGAIERSLVAFVPSVSGRRDGRTPQRAGYQPDPASSGLV